MSFSVPGADVRLFTAAYSTPDPVEPPAEVPRVEQPVPRTTRGAERRLPDSTLAEGYLVYRCANCGFVGDLRTFPTACLGCGGPREALSYEIED